MDWDEAAASLQDRHEDSDYRRVEMIAGRRKRRNWTPAEKAQIVSASVKPRANISAVARFWGFIAGFFRSGDGKWGLYCGDVFVFTPKRGDRDAAFNLRRHSPGRRPCGLQEPGQAATQKQCRAAQTCLLPCTGPPRILAIMPSTTAASDSSRRLCLLQSQEIQRAASRVSNLPKEAHPSRWACHLRWSSMKVEMKL